MLKVSEVATKLGIRESTVRLWLVKRKIAYVRLSRRAVRVPQSEIDRLIRENTIPASRNGA
jgi:excisionase family DNA binding protein